METEAFSCGQAESREKEREDKASIDKDDVVDDVVVDGGAAGGSGGEKEKEKRGQQDPPSFSSLRTVEFCKPNKVGSHARSSALYA